MYFSSVWTPELCLTRKFYSKGFLLLFRGTIHSFELLKGSLDSFKLFPRVLFVSLQYAKLFLEGKSYFLWFRGNLNLDFFLGGGAGVLFHIVIFGFQLSWNVCHEYYSFYSVVFILFKFSFIQVSAQPWASNWFGELAPKSCLFSRSQLTFSKMCHFNIWSFSPLLLWTSQLDRNTNFSKFLSVVLNRSCGGARKDLLRCVQRQVEPFKIFANRAVHRITIKWMLVLVWCITLKMGMGEVRWAPGDSSSWIGEAESWEIVQRC